MFRLAISICQTLSKYALRIAMNTLSTPTIILVSFHSYEAVVRYHDKLFSSRRYPVIVVDNASSDDSGRKIADRYPWVTLLQQERNLGYGRAANVGILAATSSHALLLNPDLTASEEAIDRLMAHAQASADDVAMLGPCIDTEEQSPRAAPREVEWISGCAMLFNVAVMKDVGVFDENIFLYSEETELCERTRRKERKILKCDDVLFEHDAGKSTTPNPSIEYMRWWHFGWSNSYRLSLRGNYGWMKSPRRRMITSRIHSWLSTNPMKRMKWKAKADGIAAFLRGEKAFDAEGYPMKYPFKP